MPQATKRAAAARRGEKRASRAQRRGAHARASGWGVLRGVGASRASRAPATRGACARASWA
eukprot:4315953-Prymnesium_polylepis.1